VLLHVIAIYVLASGLAQNLLSKLPQEFKAEVIPPKQEVVKPPPPPPPDLQKPPPPFVPPPENQYSDRDRADQFDHGAVQGRHSAAASAASAS